RSLADDLTELPCQAGDIAFFSGITMAVLSDVARERLLAVLAKARENGVTVAFDPNLRPRLWPDTQTMCTWVMAAAHISDIALPSFEDEQGYFGDGSIEATAKRYSDAGVTTVIVKDGPGPVLVQRGDERLRVATEPAEVVVDTTAAGDSFNAGYLVGRIGGSGEEEAVRQGCRLARKVIGARGALVEV
ncbi:MAG: PfkB family carbohydrate kinase, partial [Pseudomonadota bacterium]